MSKTWIEILELITLSSVAMLTLLGNFLVILAFVVGPRTIRTLTNYFVVSLAVSDIMVGSLSVPFWIVFRADPSLVNPTVYSYFIGLDILCGTASILSLAAISLERLFAVQFPTTHFNLKSTPVLIAIASTWTVGLIMTASKFAVPDKNTHSLRLYTAFIFVLVFLLPLAVILVSYFLIFLSANKMMKAANRSGQMIREIHVAKTISVIICLFILCWMPFFIVNMLFVFCANFCDKLPKWLIYVSKLMHYCNSMMNFFVYARRSPDFRRSFEAIVFKCDTSILRQRLRTFSETIGRHRSFSERNDSVVHDTNANSESNNHTETAHALPKRNNKRSRLSSYSNCTEISAFDESVVYPLITEENGKTEFVTSC